VRVLRLLLQGNWLHWVVFAALLLATILIPFAIWAEHEWKVMNPALVAVTAALLLAADIVLPIVSRVVGATLRKILGAWLGTLTGVARLTPGLHSQLLDRMDNRKSGYARGGRHGCAKILAVAPHVEIFLSNCIGGSQIILHTRRSLPCWRIVFSTFRECMSFHTGAMWDRSPGRLSRRAGAGRSFDHHCRCAPSGSFRVLAATTLSNVGISVVYATIGALASDAWSFMLALPWP
jgi:hypothetical protein